MLYDTHPTTPFIPHNWKGHSHILKGEGKINLCICSFGAGLQCATKEWVYVLVSSSPPWTVAPTTFTTPPLPNLGMSTMRLHQTEYFQHNTTKIQKKVLTYANSVSYKLHSLSYKHNKLQSLNVIKQNILLSHILDVIFAFIVTLRLSPTICKKTLQVHCQSYHKGMWASCTILVYIPRGHMNECTLLDNAMTS